MEVILEVQQQLLCEVFLLMLIYGQMEL
jgi:hypothetical protein